MTVRLSALCLVLVCLLPVPGRAAAPATAAAAGDPGAVLDDLAKRQQALFAKAEKEGENLDEANFRQAAQKLVEDYDDFIKKYPKYAPVYAAYGTMLLRLDMNRQAAAVLIRGDAKFTDMEKEPGVDGPAFRRNWALLKKELGNYSAEEGHPVEAAGFFLAAIDLVPTEPLYHYELGRLLAEARDDFVKEGDRTRAEVDQSMQDAYRRAAELAPERFEFQYDYAASFYGVENPDWDAALRLWAVLEEKADSDLERDTMRLHAANVLIRQKKYDHARLMLASVEQPGLDAQKQKLVAQLPADPAK
jgi:hypothetical protein